MRVEPSVIKVRPGQTAEMAVVVERARNLGGFQLQLRYDPRVVKVTAAQLGTLLGSTGRETVLLGPEIDDEFGRVKVGGFSYGDPPGPSGEGNLVRLSIEVLGDSGELEFAEVKLVTEAGSDQEAEATGASIFASNRAYLPLSTMSH